MGRGSKPAPPNNSLVRSDGLTVRHDLQQAVELSLKDNQRPCQLNEPNDHHKPKPTPVPRLLFLSVRLWGSSSQAEACTSDAEPATRLSLQLQSVQREPSTPPGPAEPATQRVSQGGGRVKYGVPWGRERRLQSHAAPPTHASEPCAREVTVPLVRCFVGVKSVGGQRCWTVVWWPRRRQQLDRTDQ